MRVVRMMGLCLVAALAVAIAAAGSASAESMPYYATYNAKTKESKPLGALVKVGVKATNNERSKLEGLVVIECASNTAKGNLEGPKRTVKLKVTYTGCEAPAISSQCETKVKYPGIIELTKLVGELTYASETKGGTPRVANKLVPETRGEEGDEYVRFSCGPREELLVVVTGAVLGEVSPVNGSASKTGELILSEKAKEEGFGCTKQALLFINGAGTCQHLSTHAGAAWNVARDPLVFSKAIQVIG
jgi:hypothetical protein